MRGATYHVMSRGNRKAVIFEDDADRRRFARLLGEAAGRYRLLCHSYCLMGNHYHAVIECSDANLSAAMNWLNGVFAQYSNRRHGRSGHLLQGRFKSVLIGDDIYLRAANTYVLMNPVKAGLVEEPSEWKWSSYRATVGMEAPPCWLDLSLAQLGLWRPDAAGCTTELQRVRQQTRRQEPVRGGACVWRPDTA